MSIRFRLALILLVTVAHRAVLAWATYIVHPDAGTTGVMALDILEGERPLFLYGYNYSGSLLAYLIALSFRCFGVSIATQVLPGILLTAGWVLASYLLFRELFNRGAGLAAALTVAIPDWITARYSMTPDCSYSPLFFLVTLALWLSYRIAMHELKPAAYWGHVLALGLAAGLALWTHPIAVAYLLCGLGILLPFFLRRRFRRETVLPFVVGGVLFALCLTPYLHAPGNAGSSTTTWVPRAEVISLNYAQVFNRVLPRIVHWPIAVPTVLHALAELAVCAGGVLWFLRILTGTGRNDRIWAVFPLLVCGVYLCLLLPHQMAVSGYLRYGIPVWTMLMAGMTAVCIASSRTWVRLPGALLLSFWLIYNSVGFCMYARHARPETAATRANFHRAIDRATALGLSQVVTVGGYYDGMNSQVLTLLAKNQIRFSYAGDERHRSNAQAADAAVDPAFAAFNRNDFDALKQSLDALGATYLTDEGPWMQLAYDVDLPFSTRRALLPREMLIRLYNPQFGDGDNLLDRRQATYVSGAPEGDTALLLDLGTQRNINGIAMLPREIFYPHLPASYRLEGSEKGGTFHLIREVDAALPISYRDGAMAYFGGEYGRIDCRFATRRVRYLRLTGIRSSQPDTPWRLSELYVFEHIEDRPAPHPEILVDRLAGPPFTATDRWLSTHLLNRRPASAWPRHNTHLQRGGLAPPPTRRSITPGPTCRIAVNQAFGNDLESTLRTAYGADFSWRRDELEAYAVFEFPRAPGPDAPPLLWNGATFVR